MDLQQRFILGSLGLLVAASFAVSLFMERPHPGFGTVPQSGLERAYDRTDFQNAARVAEILEDVGFEPKDWSQSRQMRVPAFFAPQLPQDLAELSTDDRKSLFIRLLVPLGLAVNAEIMADRRLVESALRQNRLSVIEPIAQRHGLSAEEVAEDPQKLLRRLDVVPLPLLVAQGIEESGWGTGRFAREGNNLFGQQGAGMIPLEAVDGRSMAAFPTLRDAVRSYVHNLNNHTAYEQFRRVRALFRQRGTEPDSHVLAGTLHAYSERGMDYVDGLKRIIETNELKVLSGAKLDL